MKEEIKDKIYLVITAIIIVVILVTTFYFIDKYSKKEVCTQNEIIKDITAQSNFWGTEYFINTESGVRSVGKNYLGYKIGDTYCVKTEWKQSPHS